MVTEKNWPPYSKQLGITKFSAKSEKKIWEKNKKLQTGSVFQPSPIPAFLNIYL